MKSIKRRFLKIQKENPNLGDYIVFARAIAGGNFTRARIARAFNELVPKDDYDQKDKKDLLGLLCGGQNDNLTVQKTGVLSLLERRKKIKRGLVSKGTKTP